MKNQNSDWINQIRRERLQGSSRNPGTAALMSFFLMGMGQIYAGHIDRGIILLFLHLGGIFAAVSIYTGGLVYNTVFPLFGAHLLIIFCYVASVIYILLWIYNIKDAYYLALFSSFRDWFEVERVLVPMLQQSSGGLLAGPASYQALPDSDFQDKEELMTESPAPEDEEADVVELKVAPSSQKTSADKTEKKPDREEETVINPEGFATLRVAGSSWKIYAGLASIFILLGIWINNNFVSKNEETFDPMTHFVVSATMGTVSDAKEDSAAVPASGSEEMSLTSGSVPFMKGMQILSAGNFSEAVDLFEQDFSISAEPSAAQWKAILSAYYRSDKKVAYETRLRQYLKKYNDDYQSWFNLGKVLYDRNEPAQAAQAIANGLKFNPTDLRGNYLLGSIYLDLKLYADAVPYLQKIVELEPLNPEFNKNLARALMATGQNDEAVRFFQRVLSLMPEDKEARMAVNSARVGAKPIVIPEEDENAVVVIQGKTDSRIIEKNTEVDVPVAAVGKVLFEAPQTESNQVPEISPEIIRQEVAKTEPKKEELKAVKQKTEIEADTEKKPVIKASAGISEIEAGLKPEARGSSAKKDEKDSGDEGFKNFVAQEQEKNAEDELNELRKKGSSDFSRGNWEAALESYLKVLQKKKDAGVFETVSIIFEKLNSPKDAFSAVEHAYQLGKRDSNALIRLGRLAHTVGDNAKGEFYLFHALQKMPHRIDLRILYAGCLHANGKSAVAEQELKRVIDASKDSYAVRRRAELELQKIRSGK